MDKALIANMIVIILELAGFNISRSRGLMMLAFYTQLSNLVTLVSSVCYIINSGAAFTAAMRYLSTVMLIMTVLVTLFVLIPSGAGFRRMMLSGNGLFHHTLCPAVSVTSYILWETHSSMWVIPVIVTLVYGIAMLYLNHKEVVDGPYPFLRVHEQSVKATVIWMVVLILLIAAISLAVAFIAK